MAEHFIVEQCHYQSISGPPEKRLSRLAALNRINALACIKSANHGWLGACFSAAEIATTVCFGLENHELVLSKEHAAALQYACLVGLGRLAPERLLTYKSGPGGPQGWSDVGIFVDLVDLVDGAALRLSLWRAIALYDRLSEGGTLGCRMTHRWVL